jgi:hypothetical protein
MGFAVSGTFVPGTKGARAFSISYPNSWTGAGAAGLARAARSGGALMRASRPVLHQLPEFIPQHASDGFSWVYADFERAGAYLVEQH